MNDTPYELLDDAAFLEQGLTTLRSMITKSIEQNGRCILGLSGGKTPAGIYEALGKDGSIDWSKVHVFLCDERYVPLDHEDSNQQLIRSTLLASAAIPEENIHFPNTSLPLEECIAAYDADLASLLAGPADVVTLGIGGDGHTASLFPPLPQEAFGPTRVIHTETNAFAVKDRISVTLPVLTDARARILVLRGRDKIETWQEMTVDGADERFWPLKAVMETGDVTVIVGR